MIATAAEQHSYIGYCRSVGLQVASNTGILRCIELLLNFISFTKHSNKL